MRSLSFSRLFTFNTCQRKYRYIYVDKIKRPPGGMLVFGSALHKVEEFAFKRQVVEGERESLSDQKDYFVEDLDQRVEEGVEYDKDDNRDKLQKDGLAIVEAYEKEIAPHVEPVDVEVPFQIEFEDQDWSLIGRMDIVEKDKISDMKFGRAAINDLDPKLQIQLGIYKFADKLMNPKQKKPKKVEIQSVRRLVRSKPAQQIPVKTYLDENQVMTNVGETARAINNSEKSGDFPQVLNTYTCSWCQYRDLCGLPGGK